MKQLTILSGRCLVVELPEGHKYYRLHNSIKIPGKSTLTHSNEGCAFFEALPPGNWRIIGMLGEMTEEQAYDIVQSFKFKGGYLYNNYITGNRDTTDTALESLESTMLAIGFYFENPYGKDEPVIDDPDPHSQYYGAQQDELGRWEQAQSRVLCREQCVILQKVN